MNQATAPDHLAQSEFGLGGPQDFFYSADNKGDVPTIVQAKGIYMWDDRGSRFIDVSSGPVISNIGHGVASVGEAMARQASVLDYAYSRVARHVPNMDLAARVCRLAGPGYERACFTSGGSEAMEVALKFVRQYALAMGQPNRRRFISLMPSYHGATMTLTGISGDLHTADVFGELTVASEKIPAPFTYRLPANHTPDSFAEYAADQLEAKILELGPESVLAFILEPVGGLATGANVPPSAYFRRIKQICTKYGVYLIFDEVMTGAGRTGQFLAAHHWPDALPDIVVLAKGIGAGYSPLGVMLAPAAMVDELAERTGFNYSFTYNANPITCAAGLAVLDYVQQNDLISNATCRGESLRRRLFQLQQHSSILGDIRGLGLLLAVELVRDKETKEMLPAAVNATGRIRALGRQNGLMIYSRRTNGGRYGDWFMVSPPLTVTEADLAEIVERLDRTIGAFESELRSARVL